MAVYSLRNLASYGINTDVDSANLPVEAFSFASNARFQDGKIQRGPIISTFITTATNPRNLFFYTDQVGGDHFLYMDNLAAIYETSVTASTNVSATTGFTPLDSLASVTSTSLSDVIYFNRSDQTPFYRTAQSTGLFAKLETYNSGWTDPLNSSLSALFPANTRFNALRSFNSMLIGLNITQGSVSAPTSLYWSDYAITDGQPPLNWQVASTTASSGINTLSEMRGNIVDGAKLAQTFLILGSRETWRMDPNGNVGSIFNFSRVYDSGVINVNCFVEHDSRLFVFGDRDIYITDGSTRNTIATGKIRDFVFNYLAIKQKAQSFVFHNQELNEIMFCFVSNDPDAKFKASTSNLGCNRAVVYNYASSTWTTQDLPYVTSAALINTFNGLTWAAATISWDSITGSWTGLADGATDVVAISSNASVSPFAASAAIRTMAIYEDGVASGTIDTFANAPCIIRKDQMDCGDLSDIPGLSAKLRDYKRFRAIYVKGFLYPESAPVSFSIGVSDQPSDNPTYGDPITWTQQFSKLDCNLAGRYLSLAIEYDDVRSFRIDGLDFDIVIEGGAGT